jgi:tetratricopeptide (TPR) repeat protein
MYSTAIDVAGRSRDVRARAFGATSLEAASSLDLLGDAHRYAGSLRESQAALEEALRIRRALGDTRSLAYADTVNNLGLVYEVQKQITRAGPLLEEALRLREAQLGRRHRLVAISLANVALLRKSEGRLRDAERLYREALGIRLALFGEDHPDVIRTRDAIGQTLNQHPAVKGTRETLSRLAP